LFEFLTYSSAKIQLLLLIILRASGLFVVAPVLGHKDIPKTVKVGLLIILSIMLTSTMRVEVPPVAENLWQLAGLALNEVLIGLIIGLMFRLVFHGVYTAGSIAGYQMGFAMVTVYDQNLANQVSILGKFWYIIAILIFMAIDGHHQIISSLAGSYEIIPPAGAAPAGGVGLLMIKFTAYLFVVAIKIAAPVMITLFLTDVSLGTIAKTMPTMNVFFVGFPIKIAAGLTVMAMSLPVFSYVLRQSTNFFDEQIHVVLAAMTEG